MLARVLVKRKNLGYGIETIILGRECDEWEESNLHRLSSLANLVVLDLGPQALTIYHAIFMGAESVSWYLGFSSFEDD